MVSLMTALWFAHLQAPDRVSVKPHASPVLHAINFLLGGPDPSYLPRLREYGGLQSYPEPQQGPRPRRLLDRAASGSAPPRRSGARSRTVTSPGTSTCRAAGVRSRCWATPSSTRAPSGRPSSTRWSRAWARCCGSSTSTASRSTACVPDIAAGRLVGMFEAAGWHTETVKYGRRLRALFARDGGEALRARIDAMGNEEYQRLLRADDAQLRERLPGGDEGIARLIARPRPARAAGRLPRPRRPRPRGAARGLPRHRRRARPPVGRLRLHDQGLVAADRGPSLQPLGAAQRRAVPRPRPAARAPTPRTRGAPSMRTPTRGGCARRWPARLEREPVERHEPPAVPPEARAHARGHGLDPAGARAPVRRARPRGARGRRARGHGRARTWPRRPTSAAGSTARASGASASGSTGSPTTPTPSCAGANPTTGATSSSASPRSTSSGCSASWGRRGAGRGARCCRWARSTTRSSRARTSRGRSASTPAGSRSSSGRRRASRSAPRAARTSR